MNAVVSYLQSGGFNGGMGSLTEMLKLYLGGIKIPRGHLRGPLNCYVQPV